MSKTAPGAAERPRFVSSLDEVSSILGTTERQWRTYSKRPDFPAKTPAGYDVDALAAWKSVAIAQRGTGELAAMKAEKISKENRLLDLKIEKEENRTVSRAAVDELHGRLAQRLRAFLYSKLENEMPPKMAGCDALTHRIYGRALADEIVKALQQDVDSWGIE